MPVDVTYQPTSRWRQDREVAELIEHFNHPKRFRNWGALTKSELAIILKEVDKCRNDFVYAARNYFWITTKKREEKLFSLWPGQELILQKILELKEKGLPQKILIIKARQLGCSTLIEALVAWRTMFFSGVNALVVSYDRQHTSDVLFPIMLFIYDRMPWWLQPMCASRKSEEGLFFENPDPTERAMAPGINSRVYVKGANSSTGVGQGIRLSAVHISEFADFDDSVAKEIIDEDMTNALVEDDGTFAILESTAKGANKYAHKLWKRCVELVDEAEWYPQFLPWFFEASRIRAVTPEFRLESPEMRMKERVMTEWTRCDHLPCRQYHYRYIKGEDRTGTTCPTCRVGTIRAYVLTDQQIAWIQHRRKNAARDEDSTKKLLQEMCIFGGHRISTNDGFIRLSEARGARAVETGEINAWWDKGLQPVVSVITKNGRELICTPDHLIQCSDGKWVEAQDAVGKQVQLSVPQFATSKYTVSWQHTPSCKASIEIDEDWGRFLGYIMGDGCWIKDGLMFACSAADQDVVDDICRLIRKLVGQEPALETRGQMVTVCFHNKKWFEILWNLGVLGRWNGNQTGYKRKVSVPECIWRSPKEVVREFLSALFECDGHAYKDSPRTAFFTKHIDFCRDVQLLLLGFGVNARFIKVEKINSDGRAYSGCDMRLNALASNIFRANIDFISKRKKSGCIREPQKNRQRHEFVDEVISVSPAGEQSVFDISVPESRKFSAHGIVVHNCTTAEEAFQVSGYQIFGQAAQDFANSQVRQPIAEGDLDAAGRFHGCNWNKKDEWGRPKCFQEECTLDHTHDDKPMKVWEFPQPGATYAMGADVAEGLGGRSCYSVGSIIRVNQFGGKDYQAAVWRSNRIDPIGFGYKLNFLGNYYNECQIAPEVNKYDTCLNVLRQLSYANVYRWKHVDSLNMLSQKLGWWTNASSRPRLWQTFKRWLQQELFLVKSHNLAEEMKNFVKDDDESISAGGDQDEFDDELMATMIALYTAHEADWNDNLQMIQPRSEMTLETAPFRAQCMNCQHQWPMLSIDDKSNDPSEFVPVLDNNKRVVASGGVQCPGCGSRTVTINRNDKVRPGNSYEDQIFGEATYGTGWSPDQEYMKALDYDLI